MSLPLRETFDELVRSAALDVDARGARSHLALVHERSVRGGPGIDIFRRNVKGKASNAGMSSVILDPSDNRN